MTREEAYALVAKCTFRIGPFKAVTLISCQQLLTESAFKRMQKDPLRKHGPSKDTVYPWNVVDYLVELAEEPKK
jgi:hypothetical protein